MILSKEKHFVSPELAKKMKELGFSQHSLYYWYREGDKEYRLSEGLPIGSYDELYAAYSVAELGIMLPPLFLSGMAESNLWNCWKFDKALLVADYNIYQAHTEADARAVMLISLVGKGEIDIEEIL